MSTEVRIQKEEIEDSGMVRNILRLATCSDLRSSILISLVEGKKPLSELRDDIGISSTTAIHALRELERGSLLVQDEDKDYMLTKIGDIVALKLIDFIKAIDVLKRHENFWLTHDLSGIPEHLLEKIGWLEDSNLVEDTAIDIFKVHTTFIKMLSNAKKLRGVSSIFVPEYPLLFEELILNKKADVELIVTTDVMEKISEDKSGEEILKKIFADKSSMFKLYLIKGDVKAAFTVTDSFFSFGLFYFNGTYDYNRDLVGYSEKAIEWGEELFEWYRRRSEQVYL